MVYDVFYGRGRLRRRFIRAAREGELVRTKARSFSGMLLGGFAMLVAVATGSGTAVSAETIVSALTKAYMGNPELAAAQAGQRATDELVPQAKSGWLPTVTTNSDIGRTYQNNSTSGKSDFTPGGFQIVLSHPVFDGFRRDNQLRQAEALVSAGLENLLDTEQQILLSAATAYMDVVRDRAIVGYRRQAKENFAEQVRAAQARFNVGEVTRTDVSQAQASASQSAANLAAAIGSLQSSVATFIRLVGEAPGKLEFPPLSPNVPKSLRQALEIAAETNPQILAAAFNAEAAIADIGVRRADLLPQVNFEASYQYSSNPTATTRFNEEGRIVGSLSVPLYQGGRVYSQIREAKQTASQRQLDVLQAERLVRERVVQGWHLLKAAAATIEGARDAVAANRLALDGVKQEAQVGNRTTLDVLDAETALVNSRVELANAERDRIVAGYQLVAAIGRMTAVHLGLPVRLYNPVANQNDVRDKLFGARIKSFD
jgi:TolC family type I secretion outer membrane protein